MKNLKVCIVAFVDSEGKILLNNRRGVVESKIETWELIGGGIEAGESPENAMKREISEELNYKMSEKDNLHLIKNFQLSNQTFTADIYCYKAALPELENFSDSNETFVKDLKLFSHTEALSLNLLPITKEILQKYLV